MYSHQGSCKEENRQEERKTGKPRKKITKTAGYHFLRQDNSPLRPGLIIPRRRRESRHQKKEKENPRRLRPLILKILIPLKGERVR
jgi:hypothetical protein